MVDVAAHHGGELELEEAQEEQEWWSVEIEQLKGTIRALNIQMFQERKAWLAEKQALQSEEGSGPLRRHTTDVTGGSVGGGGEWAVAQLQQQLAAVKSQLRASQEERARLAEALALAEAQASQWALERAALTRQAQVLLEGGPGHAGGAGAAAERSAQATIASLEEEKWALQMELDLIKSSFKNSLIIPRAHMASLPAQFSGMGRQASSPSPSAPSPGDVQTPQRTSGNGISALSSPLESPGPSAASIAATVTEAGALARAQAEITRLQAELYILKDECVPVPKPEYAQLKAVHSDKAAMEQEARGLRAEVGDLTRLNRMLREEIELIKEEHVAVTVQEYEELRRVAAEKQALDMKLEAQAKYYAQVPKDELLELQAARRSGKALEQQMEALRAAGSVGEGEVAKALTSLHQEAATLRIQLLEAQQGLEDARRELSMAEGRAKGAAVLQERVRDLEAAMAASQQERARLELHVRTLEDQVGSLRKQLAEASAARHELEGQVATARDVGSEARQECARLTRERGEVEARLSAMRAEREALTHELVEAKLELAKLKEMEMRYKKSVIKAQAQLYGTPMQQATNPSV